MQIQKEVQLSFIDYVKAFDKVRHKDPVKLLGKLYLLWKEIRIIQNIY